MTINLINIDTYLKAVVRTSRAIWESLRNQVSSLIIIFFTVLPYSQHRIGTRKRHRFLQGDVQTLISDQTVDPICWILEIFSVQQYGEKSRAW